MLILTLFFSVVIVVVTAIAGFLTANQVRQASSIIDSAKAIFAADAGVDWALCAIVNPHQNRGYNIMCGVQGIPDPDPDKCPSPVPPGRYVPAFTNGAEIEIGNSRIDCSGGIIPTGILMTARARNAVRAFDVKFRSGP